MEDLMVELVRRHVRSLYLSLFEGLQILARFATT